MTGDLKLIDELLCLIKQPGKSWAEMEKSGYLFEKRALARLRSAWLSGEMTEITASLGDYFERGGTHWHN